MRESLAVVLVAALHGGALAQSPPPQDDAVHPPQDGEAALSLVDALEAAARAPELAARAASDRQWSTALADVPSRPGLTAQLAPGLDALAWQGELAASFSFGRLQAARAAARADLEAIRADTSARQREQQLRAARGWLRLWSAQERLLLVERERAAAAELAELAHRARRLGSGTIVEETSAEAYVAEIELGALALEGEHAEAALTLAEVLGFAPAPSLRAEGPLPSLAAPTEKVMAMAATAATAAARAASARAREVKTAASAPSWSVGVRGEGDRTSVAAFGLLGVTLGGGDRGALGSAAARAEATRLEGVAERLRTSAALEQRRLEHEREHSAATLAAEQTRADALARQVAALTAARDAGEATLPELLLARRAALTASAAVLSARAEQSRVQVEHVLAAGGQVRP